MSEKTNLIPMERIERAIFLLRGEKVMLDNDLAELYGVETKVLNQAVRRNAERFPADFCFRLTREEAGRVSRLRSQIVTSKAGRGGRRYPQGYVAFGCGSAEMIVFIPAKEFVPWLERFWTTELEDRSYWHVRIVGNNAKLTMDTKAGFKPIDVTQYLFK